jgi:hypothetical protein
LAEFVGTGHQITITALYALLSQALLAKQQPAPAREIISKGLASAEQTSTVRIPLPPPASPANLAPALFPDPQACVSQSGDPARVEFRATYAALLAPGVCADRGHGLWT